MCKFTDFTLIIRLTPTKNIYISSADDFYFWPGKAHLSDEIGDFCTHHSRANHPLWRKFINRLALAEDATKTMTKTRTAEELAVVVIGL